MSQTLEELACNPSKVRIEQFNKNAKLPLGLRIEHVCSAMNDFIDFVGFINQQLATKRIQRLETMLMPANFSSIVGEFVTAAIPKYCSTVCKNAYHNGHPDLIEKGKHPKDSIQHYHEGIEVKASRYLSAWQGHNAEDTWLMVFMFESGRPTDAVKGIKPKPFRFVRVVGAELVKADWTFAGRSETSRRTITASINNRGYEKMMANWIFEGNR